MAGQAADRGERRAVAHGAQERDDVPDDVPVRVHEPARRLRDHVGAERGQKVEDPPPADPHLFLDQHLQQAPDGAGPEEADEPDRRGAGRRAQGRGERRTASREPARCSSSSADRRPRRLRHGLVGRQARHALDGEGGLVERAAGQGPLDQLVEPGEDRLGLLVLVAAEEVEERLGELAAHRVLRERRDALPEGLERAEDDRRPRGPGEHGAGEQRHMVLRVVPVDVLLAKQREELAAEGFQVSDRRRLLFHRVGARGGEELHQPLGVARERHALGAQLTQHAEHRVGAHGGGEGLEGVLALGVGGDHAQRGAHETLPERLREPHDELGRLPGRERPPRPGHPLEVGRRGVREPDEELPGSHLGDPWTVVRRFSGRRGRRAPGRTGPASSTVGDP